MTLDKLHNPKQESFLSKAGIAGGVCAFVSALLNPIDVTKIRLQNQSSKGNQAYAGLFNAMTTIYREEGFKGLLRGMEPSMMREVSYSSLRIGGYEPIRHSLSFNTAQDPTNASPVIKFAAALLSGGLGSAVANPFDLIKTRFQAVLSTQPLPYRSTFHAIRVIYGADGFAGLYKGWMVTSARAAVLTSAQLGSYDSIKHNVVMRYFHVKDGLALHFGVAMLSGLITTTASNPFDVIKTRYLSDRSGQYKSILDCVSQTFRIDGMKGFFKGWTPAYLRVGPHTVLTLLLIEEVRAFFGLSTI